MTITTRLVTAQDRAEWGRLYADYAAFYGTEQTEEMRERVWGWLMDDKVEMWCWLAVQDGRPVGLAHLRSFLRPLASSVGGYLDDLYVEEGLRGSGAGRLLLTTLNDECRARGWTVLRWITAHDNARAQILYDKVAKKTAWYTYDMPV